MGIFMTGQEESVLEEEGGHLCREDGYAGIATPA
jgi:hypothetical protein